MQRPAFDHLEKELEQTEIFFFRNLWTEIELTSWLGYRRYLLNKWVSTIKPHWKSDLLTKENRFQPGFVILVAMVTENHHFGNRHYFQGGK